MESFFRAIEDLFVNILFAPFDMLRMIGELVDSKYLKLDFCDGRLSSLCVLDVAT